MLSRDLLLAACMTYVAALFVLAFMVDRQARKGRESWIHSPVIYTLSISVYCTSWTFYGAVGYAARSGLEFITIYLGPTLVFVGWWFLLRKLVRIGRTNRITSIADLISSRYGKSPSLAVLVTLMALVATTPYIALQLQSVTRSYQAVVGDINVSQSAFMIAAGMALFTILFGTRNVDANERHHGVVAAIAVEAIVKFIALISVGLFAVFGVSGGIAGVFEGVDREAIVGAASVFDARWAAITFLSACAIICLPRQFQVTVVENVNERHLATAAWLFPLYLFGMCLFVSPIAITGLKTLPASVNPDLYVLALPLAHDRQDIALLAFIGGFSSATSMVIVAAVAVSTMVSNHIVIPLALKFFDRGDQVSGDLRRLLLLSRRISIGAVLGLGFLYFQLSGGSDALAAIGLIAFTGVAQFAPSLVGGIFWRGATRSGAVTGLLVGLLLWAYTLFLPSFGGSALMSAATLEQGLFGIAALRPQALFGLHGMDPQVHALLWSFGANTLCFVVVSSLTRASTLERIQAVRFVDVFRSNLGNTPRTSRHDMRIEDLFVLAQRILGADAARRLFDDLARDQGLRDALPEPDEAVIARVEGELAGAVGAASANAMVARVAGQVDIGISQLIQIADETYQLIETTRELSEKSEALTQTTEELKRANAQLVQLDARKDEFLSQVSHELRTPMTAIRSFSEILLDEQDIDSHERQRFMRIINEESQRLTRLLDEILDIGRLESGNMDLATAQYDARTIVETTLDTLDAAFKRRGVTLTVRMPDTPLMVDVHSDRLQQVLVNLLSNAMKYNTTEEPRIEVNASIESRRVIIDVTDNGRGIARADAESVFEKFVRGKTQDSASGAGLGLPISRAIASNFGGSLRVHFEQGKNSSSTFRLSLPVSR